MLDGPPPPVRCMSMTSTKNEGVEFNLIKISDWHDYAGGEWELTEKSQQERSNAAQHSTAQRHDAFSNVLCSWLCKRGEATTAPVCMPFRCVLTLLDRTGQTQLILSVSYILPYHHPPFHSTPHHHDKPPDSTPLVILRKARFFNLSILASWLQHFVLFFLDINNHIAVAIVIESHERGKIILDALLGLVSYLRFFRLSNA